MIDKEKILAEIEILRNKMWHSAYDLSVDVKNNKGCYDFIERLCLCVDYKGNSAIGAIEIDGSDVTCCSPHCISTMLLHDVYYYAYIDDLFPQFLSSEITRNIMNDKSY